MNTTHDHPTDHPFGRRMHPFGPAVRDRMRAAFEDAGVTRRQWHLLTALESTPSTVAELEDAKRRRRQERCASKDAAGHDGADRATTEHDAATATEHSTVGDARSTDAPQGPRFGRFGRRGFGPGFGPFGRGFGPGFGPHLGHHGHGAHPGRRGVERSIPDLLAGLQTRGWVEHDTDTWRLTEAGATDVASIRESLTAARASMRDGISDEDWDTAMSVLQRVAANARR